MKAEQKWYSTKLIIAYIYFDFLQLHYFFFVYYFVLLPITVILILSKQFITLKLITDTPIYIRL